MNSMTPFSGLSLIVHLLVIGVANTIKLIFGWNDISLMKEGKKNYRFPRFVHIFERIASVIIIITVIGAVSFSTQVAIKTGIREGKDELHRMYASKKVAQLPAFLNSVKSMTITNMVYASENFLKK
jgi:hypothetical protein